MIKRRSARLNPGPNVGQHYFMLLGVEATAYTSSIHHCCQLNRGKYAARHIHRWPTACRHHCFGSVIKQLTQGWRLPQVLAMAVDVHRLCFVKTYKYYWIMSLG
eukprot:GHUV01057077.1.p1 GENE.GHUV01057077.1~~GHUV01057077.1.p1  ORF type:complete len:104 (+),score=5.57 GHUV01057077.1:202-513(+)